jgi:hypothetical protein
LPRNILSWSWRSIKLLLLHLVGVLYYFTYIDDARSNKNQNVSVWSNARFQIQCLPIFRSWIKMFWFNSLSVNFIIDFLSSLKDVNTVYNTMSVPKASQNVTFPEEQMCQNCAGSQHIIIMLSNLLFIF